MSITEGGRAKESEPGLPSTLSRLTSPPYPPCGMIQPRREVGSGTPPLPLLQKRGQLAGERGVSSGGCAPPSLPKPAPSNTTTRLPRTCKEPPVHELPGPLPRMVAAAKASPPRGGDGRLRRHSLRRACTRRRAAAAPAAGGQGWSRRQTPWQGGPSWAWQVGLPRRRPPHRRRPPPPPPPPPPLTRLRTRCLPKRQAGRRPPA
ncbi:hypothetical protein I4F81_008195 [Pyropia yezoensis]|uniref:Uncharacterized protein n=1 Tax=Pyropia yezoensis TaxID=2788 RepID=A0ACC3C5S6_PYRYE|nr:hypothetical protein I4F81_008195 [Neopyropia yezoensis]